MRAGNRATQFCAAPNYLTKRTTRRTAVRPRPSNAVRAARDISGPRAFPCCSVLAELNEVPLICSRVATMPPWAELRPVIINAINIKRFIFNQSMLDLSPTNNTMTTH